MTNPFGMEVEHFFFVKIYIFFNIFGLFLFIYIKNKNKKNIILIYF
jgi:hypothetical protein